MTPDPRATWRNPRILLVLLLVFLCGSLAGALTMRFGFPIPTGAREPAAYWTQGGKELTMDHLRQELELSPAQARDIELILDDFMMYYDSLRSQMDDVRASGKNRILRVLDPDQRQRFETMLKEVPLRQTY